VKRAFNSDPARHPLRVLIATEAAREGVNLQNRCADLFHVDVPWNPSRLEQRTGRIDRKLQQSPEVRCHYFCYAQRPEDRVLQALVRKTKVIREQLGGALNLGSVGLRAEIEYFDISDVDTLLLYTVGLTITF
jgi:SNF2 family DNA or RNA helicase